MRTKGERWDLAQASRFGADEGWRMAELAGQTWGGGLDTVSISKGSDGLPWLSRNSQGQDFLFICRNTVLCHSELDSEPFGREYRLTSWQPGVLPVSSLEVAQPRLGHFRCNDVSSTLALPTAPNHCSYTAEVFFSALLNWHNPHQHCILLTCCAIFAQLPAHTCPAGKKEPLFFPNLQPINRGLVSRAWTLTSLQRLKSPQELVYIGELGLILGQP